jgi:streptomycin 6-kinase
VGAYAVSSVPVFGAFERGAEFGVNHNDAGGDRLMGLAEKYAEKWGLSNVTLLDVEAYGKLYACESAVYGACILKLCLNEPEFAMGVGYIKAYANTRCVKMFGYDMDDCVVLLERVVPGSDLWAAGDYMERARIFAEIVKDLPIKWDGCGDYPTFGTQMRDVRVKLVGLGGRGREKILFYLDEAIRIYDELKTVYNRKYLLHGDLHQFNILLNADNGYTVIDPKGVADDPVMETARYMMNELETGELEAGEPEMKIRNIAKVLAEATGVPAADVLKTMFIDTALGQCWNFDKEMTRDKFEAELKESLEICKFVYSLIEGRIITE